MQRIAEDLERKQVERLRALRLRRDPKKWQDSLKKIEEASRYAARSSADSSAGSSAGSNAGSNAGSGNLMPHIIEAVENYATVGEISDTMRKVFGEYQETVVI